ncbi:M3 family metallopeptidase [Porphyromonas uenonis]|uniref:M3 family metallopeptidase n=1 Tax=Porphyromonas uenonis TaxID=281920 RepID=UPI002672FC65|nr:M3 family metallopeptidase [Porphyromonas uenonis]
MRKQVIMLLAIATMLLACNKQKKQADLADNPFVHPSETYMNAPDFTKIKAEHFAPAFDEGMRQHNEEIAAIVDNAEAPTFTNTIEALERAGQVLQRTSAVFFALTSADTNDELRAIEAEYVPKLTAHSDEIMLNDKLFARIKTVYETGLEGLQPDQVRLTKQYYDNYVKAGANLSAEDKEKLKKLNGEEAELTAKFGNMLTDATNVPVFFTDKAQLDGLSDSELQEAADLAKEEGKEGQWAIRLVNTTQQPVMAKLNNRDSRKVILEASINRCNNGDKYDTQSIIKRLATLRAEKAQLLGFKTFADWTLQDALAKNGETVRNFLERIAKLYQPKAAEDAKMLEAFAQKSEGPDFKLEAYDWAYYAEKMRKEQFDIDEAQLSEYFVLDNVLKDGVFFAANKLYGLTFEQRTDVSVYNPDVTVYDVKNDKGEVIALYYFDPYARPSKSGGAWMSNFVEQSTLLGNKPVIYNVCNNKKPAAGQPCLMTWDEVTTLFHEFGHALHGMLSTQTYPSISGTNVSRDFVEFPSQFNEHWATEPTVFANYAKHYKTGEQMPAELRDKMIAAGNFNQAYSVGENLAASLIDQCWHALAVGDKVDDVQAFEQEALTKYGMLNAQIPPRYRSPYFRHIWSNDYSAGYYSYLWSEAVDNEVYAWIEAHGGMTRENGQRLADILLSRGNSEDLMVLFEQFTGHKEVDIEPLLRFRGLR